MEDNQTQLDFLFNNSSITFMGEPELKLNIQFASFIEETQKIEDKKIQTDVSQESVRKKRFPKRFFYEHDYEIYYSNKKNKMMIKSISYKMKTPVIKRHTIG